MKLRRPLLISALLSTSVGFTACGGSSPGTPDQGAGGSSAAAGGKTGSGGNSGSGGSTVGSGGSGNGAGGVTTGAGGGGAGGLGAGGVGAGGTGLGGMGAGVGGGAGGPPAASSEDDGADCVVTGVPDSSALVANAKLPDPFKKLDGTRMTTKAEWRCRREEIRKLEEKFVYGTKPPTPQSVSGTVTSTMITVQVTDNGKSASFSAGVKLPTSGTAPYPVIIEYTTDTSGAFGPPLDTGVLNSEGVAVVYLPVYSVGAEGNGHSATAQSGAFYSIYSGGSATSLLTAWGWGVSRVIDVIAKNGSSMLRADAVGRERMLAFRQGGVHRWRHRSARRFDHAGRVRHSRPSDLARRECRRWSDPGQRLRRATLVCRRLQPLHDHPDEGAFGHP